MSRWGDPWVKIFVSILTDSWESVQRDVMSALSVPIEFQSSPTPGSRCNSSPTCLALHLQRFNPHRLLGVGATPSVAITGGDGSMFQSSPTPGSRCNTAFKTKVGVLSKLFQSSPTPGSRCNPRRPASSTATRSRFNPHRLLGVGATLIAEGPRPLLVVSILTDSWESVQRYVVVLLAIRLVVSILTDSWESVQPMSCGGTDRLLAGVSILTDSWESVQPVSGSAEAANAQLFQSSPTPGSRCNPLCR